MANRIKKKEDTKSSYRDNVALIMGAFTLIVLCVLPLVFHDFYFDILETKYQFYSRCACDHGRIWPRERKDARVVLEVQFPDMEKEHERRGLGDGRFLAHKRDLLDPVQGLEMGGILGNIRTL